MSDLRLVTSNMLLAMMMQQTLLQAQLIEAQQQIIELQNQLSEKQPITPKDEEAFWHVAANGLLSTEAAESNDVVTVKKFLDWNVDLAEKHVKPYVNPKVYGEVVNQMTRGLPERIAHLQTRRETHEKKSPKKKDPEGKRIIQLALLQDA